MIYHNNISLHVEAFLSGRKANRYWHTLQAEVLKMRLPHTAALTQNSNAKQFLRRRMNHTILTITASDLKHEWKEAKIMMYKFPKPLATKSSRGLHLL